MALLERIWETYNYLGYECADYRSRHMFPSLLFVIIIIPVYLYFCKSLGPRLMKNRPPFELKTTIFYYNLFQIFANIYIIYEGGLGGWFTGYSYTCQPVDWTDNPKSRQMLNAVWWYTTVKIIDLLDTVFFVLRKKERQISFLHVFHHSLMILASYVGLKYYPNGHGTDVGYANTIIHVVMYTYYLIAGLGPKYQKYLWWKKYLTVMQIVQFVLLFIHNMLNVLNPECEYPKWISFLISLNSVLFIIMFSNFYYDNYVEPLKQSNSKHVIDTENKHKNH